MKRKKKQQPVERVSPEANDTVVVTGPNDGSYEIKSEDLDVFASIERNKKQLTSADIALPDSSHLDDLLTQRGDQRNKLFEFAMSLSRAALLFLVGIVMCQSIGKTLFGTQFSIFNGHELEVLVIGVFGEIISVISIITRSLWDDRTFKDALMFDHNNKHKK